MSDPSEKHYGRWNDPAVLPYALSISGFWFHVSHKNTLKYCDFRKKIKKSGKF